MNTLVYSDTRWYMQLLSQDTLIDQLYSLDTPVLLSIYTQDVCMLQFHTMVLLVLDTQVYFGHCSFTRWCCRFSEYTGIDGSTVVSHVGAAGSLNNYAV